MKKLSEEMRSDIFIIVLRYISTYIPKDNATSAILKRSKTLSRTAV